MPLYYMKGHLKGIGHAVLLYEGLRKGNRTCPSTIWRVT